MAEEGAGGSSRQRNVNPGKGSSSPAREPAWLVSRLDEDDDPLLDISEDRPPQQQHSRLEIDYERRGHGVGGYDNGPTVFDSSRSSADNVTRLISPRNTISGIQGYATASEINETSGNEPVQRGDSSDLLGGGDPTFVAMDYTRKYPGQGNPARASGADFAGQDGQHRAYSPSESSPLNTRSSLPNGSTSHVVGKVAVASPAVAPPPTSVSERESLASAGVGVIDYTDNNATGSSSHYSLPSPHRQPEVAFSRGSGRMSREVMLDSFPPPPYGGLGGAGNRAAGRGVGAEGDEVYVHCHSGTSRREMSDKLARRQLLAVLVLCVLFMIGETVGGVLANSLALFTDVLHLASDLISYAISLLALYLSKKQATKRMTFGYHRAEVLGAMLSVFIIWLVSGVLCYIAVERIVHEHYKEVKPNEMLITATLGVVFNLIMGFVLNSEKCCGFAKGHTKFGHGHGHSHSHNSHGHSRFRGISRGSGSVQQGTEYEPLDVASSNEDREEEYEEEETRPAEETEPQAHKNINVRAAFIHVVGDILQSLGVLTAALIIKFTDDEKYRLADPICTFLFSVLVLFTTINVLRDTVRIVMEGAPQGVDFEHLKSVLMSLDAVVTVHNLNVWALTMDRNALSVHLAIDDSVQSVEVLKEATKALKRHNFYHVTIQVEPYNHDVMTSCQDCQLPEK